MTKTAHTPGPWKVSRPVSITIGFNSEAHYVRGNADEGWPVVANTKTDLPREEQLANARLIAAAPELLEASKEFLAYFTNDGGNKSQEWLKTVRQNLKQAISKSEGK